jgi:superoxide dismutase, Fe-Mn family
MTYEMKPLSCNPTKLNGLSERLIVSHYENNYGGAVKRLNAITAQLESLDFTTAPVFVINGLKREELIASNSMILHELYFAGPRQGRRARQRPAERAGSPFREFRAMADSVCCYGQGVRRWLRMGFAYLLPQRQKTDQPMGRRPYLRLAGASPILALDMYEHSFHMDYGAKAAAYVDAFVGNINWKNVSALFRNQVRT